MSATQATEKKMKETVSHLQEELKHIRTGRADPSMLKNLQVEVYGTQMRLSDIATVTAPEARQLLITPFDPQNAGSIRKGIEKANLNFNPILEAGAIRINIPAMDESMRKEMVKVAKKKAEDSKIAIRNARRDGNEALKNQKSKSEITEDQLKRFETDIQKLAGPNRIVAPRTGAWIETYL